MLKSIGSCLWWSFLWSCYSISTDTHYTGILCHIKDSFQNWSLILEHWKTTFREQIRTSCKDDLISSAISNPHPLSSATILPWTMCQWIEEQYAVNLWYRNDNNIRRLSLSAMLLQNLDSLCCLLSSIRAKELCIWHLMKSMLTNFFASLFLFQQKYL